ncbi:MAG TPA: hypothetical protein VHT52_17905 [Stellaceae bacterium]|jgi:hypothetical protein|nr:hypothetical protein [Stellaceae bacterium]
MEPLRRAMDIADRFPDGDDYRELRSCLRTAWDWGDRRWGRDWSDGWIGPGYIWNRGGFERYPATRVRGSPERGEYPVPDRGERDERRERRRDRY